MKNRRKNQLFWLAWDVVYDVNVHFLSQLLDCEHF